MAIWTPNELERYSQRTRIGEEDVLSYVQQALLDGRLLIGYPTQNTANYSGGTNFCPNSDFSWSHLAATVPGTLPSNTSDDNKRCYRVFRQAIGADVVPDAANSLKVAGVGSGEESVAYIPVWNKALGVAEIGSDDVADNYDIAIRFDNNWVVPSKTWYIRVACATRDSTPVPNGLKLFVGFWVEDSVGQGWISEDPFTLTYTRLDTPVVGGTTYEYKVIARTDGGNEVESSLLSLSDVGVLSSSNRIQIEFYGASGYLEFETYRRNTTTGEVHLIDFQRNSTNLSVVDQGQSLRVEPSGFPSSSGTSTLAYAEHPIEAYPITQYKVFNDFTIRIPTFAHSDLVSEGTYLRIGLKSDVACAVDRQIMIDTVWASESYNRWSPNPNDGYGSLPSVSITTGVGTAGSTNPYPPIIGGGQTCVWEEQDILLDRGTNLYTPLKQAITGLRVENGKGKNFIGHFIDGEVSQYYEVTFSHGLTVKCTASHRWIRSLEDGSGVSTAFIQAGDTFLGLKNGEQVPVTVEKVELKQGELRVRATKVASGSENLYYAVGDGERGLYVYSHNYKLPEELT